MAPERSRRLAPSGSEGWSLPIIPILFVILVALHFVFGWIVWPAVIGFGLLVTGGVWVGDRVRNIRARRAAEREWASWPDVEADWSRGMKSPRPTDPTVTAGRFAEFLSERGYELDFSSSSLITELDPLFDKPVFALGSEELKTDVEGGLAAYVGGRASPHSWSADDWGRCRGSRSRRQLQLLRERWCQFNEPTTHGNCHFAYVGTIVGGHFSDTPLAGLNWAMLCIFPGEIAEGNAKRQIVIDERADEAQRLALETIISGDACEPLSNHFSVFGSLCSEVFRDTVPADRS